MHMPSLFQLAFLRSPRAVMLLTITVLTIVFLLILALSGRQARASNRTNRSDPERGAVPSKSVSRRDLLRGGLVASVLVFVAEFGGASLAFLWPSLKGQFGSVVEAGSVSDIKAFISSQNQPFYLGAGRFYVVPYSGSGTDTIYKGVVDQGLMALYQRCVHLGCRVPFCQTSQWFECPCHGSKYDEAGEYQLGPAPRGLDRFKLTVESGGRVVVDTSAIITGPPRGTDTTHQAPQGAFCVGGAAGG
jgi:cytochrome b6-f complex iron-sulfur subunit